MVSDNENILFQSTFGRSPEEIAQLKARLRGTYSADFSATTQGLIQSKKKKKKTRCITRAMAEDFSREHVLWSSFIGTIFYVLFVFTYSVHVCTLKTSDLYYLNNAVKHELLNRPFDSKPSEIFFREISTVTNMWQFISSLFMNSIDIAVYSSQKGEKFLHIGSANVILGVPRIRQVRVKDASCEVNPTFSELFRLCFGPYEEKIEDVSKFGLGIGSAWVYSNMMQTRNSVTVGKVGRYNGGGYYIDLNLDGEKAAQEIQTLRANKWITRNTRAVIIQFTTYNVNLDIFGSCKALFEFPQTGGIIPTFKYDSYRMDHTYIGSWINFSRVCEFIASIFIFFQIIQSLREMVYFKFRYLIRFWSYIDWTIYVFAMTTFVLNNQIRFQIGGQIRTIIENPSEYGNLDYLMDIKEIHDDLSAVTLFFVIMRFFKYLNFNKTMGQLNDTLKRCAVDVLVFAVMFFIIFCAFAELGFLLFGTQIKSFRSFGHSMLTLLRAILGDFNYLEIEEAHAIIAPIYFLSYIILVFFVLLNMFLAIINDTYAEVKTEIALAPTELQMIKYLKNRLFQMLHKIRLMKLQPDAEKSQFTLIADEMRKALEQCGFTYLEIEMFFSCYNINPVTIVTEYDVTKLVNELESMIPSGGIGKMESDDVQHTEELLARKQQLKEMELPMIKLSAKIKALMKLLEKLGNKNKDRRSEVEFKGDIESESESSSSSEK